MSEKLYLEYNPEFYDDPRSGWYNVYGNSGEPLAGMRCIDRAEAVRRDRFNGKPLFRVHVILKDNACNPSHLPE